jgi:hypothetical protein
MFGQNIEAQVGFYSKALTLQKNEDFLGDIHLKTASALHKLGDDVKAKEELSKYAAHREKKGWNLSSQYSDLKNQLGIEDSSGKDVKEYICIAEDLAYSAFDWQLFVVASTWMLKGNEMIEFSDGNELSFSIRSTRMGKPKVKQGDVWEFKINETGKSDDHPIGSWESRSILRRGGMMRSEKKIECSPLIWRRTEHEPWSCLEEISCYVDYLNMERNVLHLIGENNKQIFLSNDGINLDKGHFVKGKLLKKVIRKEDGTVQTKRDLFNAQKIEKEMALLSFRETVAVIDHVNQKKELFHYVINSHLGGVIRFSECDIKPTEGDLLLVKYVSHKSSKTNKHHVAILDMQLAPEGTENQELVKKLEGYLEVTYKSHGNDYPDFGFVNDIYVPGYQLENAGIMDNKNIKATAVFTGEKWKVVQIE